MKKSFLFITTVCLLLSGSIHSQVTIGSGTKPLPGALLDLKDGGSYGATGATAVKGLGMPRVKLESLSKLKMGANEILDTDNGGNQYQKHTGLIVYNTNQQETANRLCYGLHVWDGTKWQPIVPYPVWENKRELVSDKIIGFTHLDPANPADPNYGKWAELGKNPASYPLGYLGTFPDNRAGDAPQAYHHTRYYVGVANRQKTYEVKTSFSCDPNTPNWITGTVTDPAYDIFEDGVWMNENLRAEIMDPTRDKTGETVATLTGPDYNTGNPSNTTVWGYPNALAVNKATHGLLYTWAAATNAKGGATGQGNAQREEGLSEGLPIQGVCPTGWHLPSDREFTDLENGIILHTALFSSTPNINTRLNYTSTGYRGGVLGYAMRHTNTGSGDNKGTSKLPAGGGFGFVLAGSAGGGATSLFGRYGSLWSASSNLGSLAWYREFREYDGVGRTDVSRVRQYSVRCKKN